MKTNKAEKRTRHNIIVIYGKLQETSDGRLVCAPGSEENSFVRYFTPTEYKRFSRDLMKYGNVCYMSCISKV